MEAKFEFIAQRANQLIVSKHTISGQLLADELNGNGFLTNNGTLYAGGRGTFRTISATCDKLRNEGRPDEAEDVVYAFTKADGTFGWE